MHQRNFFATLPILVDHYTKLGLLKETCSFDWRDLSVAVNDVEEPLDEDYGWNLDQCTCLYRDIADPVHIPDAAGADSKSFVKQIAESQGPVVKRRLEDAPADSDYLVRDCT